MSEKYINRWHETITPYSKAPHPWTVKSGGSWDMLEVQPIPDEMLSELMQRYYCGGTPWNCRSMPLSANDREYMYLLYYSMQGLVARMRRAELQTAQADQRGDEAMRRTHAAEAALLAIVEAYDAYRRRGVAPAPGEYAGLVGAINAARTAI